MVKIKILSHSKDYTKERPSDIPKIHRNLNEEVHPLSRPREYKKALNAVKLKRHFAAPFIGNLSGASDGIYCMSRVYGEVNSIIGGSCDGTLLCWDLSTQILKFKKSNAHEGFVTGVATDQSSNIFTCGRDKVIKMWKNPNPIDLYNNNNNSEDDLDEEEEDSMEIDEENEKEKIKEIKEIKKGPQKPLQKRLKEKEELRELFEPSEIWISDESFSSLDCSNKKGLFATAGSQTISLWDINRSKCKNSFTWDTDTFTTIKFNPSEPELLATTSLDRSIILYDIRGKTPLRKVTTKMRSSSLAWNPMIPYQFVIANEDTNLYTFDIRKFSQALFKHTDHIDPVLDVDFSPTGQEFVSGSYDKTIRIWNSDLSERNSKEVYHTSRMQRIFSVKFSSDSRFILCGSEDHNIRIWKSNASEKLDVFTLNQKKSYEAKEKLIEKFIHVPEIRQIAKTRYLPKRIKSAKKELYKQVQAKKRKQENRKIHEKDFTVRTPVKDVIIREDQ